MTRVRALGQRSLPTRAARQIAQLAQEFTGRSRLFVRLAGQSGCGEQLADLEALTGVDGRAFNPEVGTRDFGLIELTGLERSTVGGRSEMTGAEQADEHGIDGVARPAIGRMGKVSADVLALLAGADERQDRRTDRVILGLAAVIQYFQRVLGTLSSALDDLGPAVVVGVLEIVEDPVEGGVDRLLDLAEQRRFESLTAAPW